MTDEQTHPDVSEPLLDETVEFVAAAASGGPTKPPWTRVFRMTPTELLSAAAGGVSRHRRVSAGVLAAVLIGGGVWGWLAWRIEPPPDYETEPLDVLFDYTLLTDDFNRLSIEERLALIEQLVTRLKSFSSSDSVLLAMFATMIMGEARAQLEENISRLAIDVSDKFASEYDPNASPEAKDEFLQDAYLGMVSMFDFADGEVGEHTPEELLDEGRRQAKRDLNRFEQGRIGAGEVVRVFDLMNNKVGKHMSGHQKMRVSAMFRDMTEMLRAEP